MNQPNRISSKPASALARAFPASRPGSIPSLLGSFRWVMAASLLLGLSGLAHGRDAFVVLSGGATPESNNYSQYVQARAMAQFFLGRYPAKNVWLFFGAGNVEGEPPKFLDVRRDSKQTDGTVSSAWLPGALPANHPAKHDTIVRALRDEILPAVHDGGTLFLFVGDHGDQRDAGGVSESIINLWEPERDATAPHGWRNNPDEKLGVAELRELFLRGLGQGKVVFCMTQCHSGGFHFLSVPREMKPLANWYRGEKAPADAPAMAPLPIAGYTATNESTVAAGCTPDPDPDQWAGYERYLPENLLGQDLLSGKNKAGARPSFHAAHVEATLIDLTVDKPYSTSEQFLERWAQLIETQLANEPNLTEKIKSAVYDYRCAVETAQLTSIDPAFHERQGQFAAFTQELANRRPELASILLHGTRQQLVDATQPFRPDEPKQAASTSKLDFMEVVKLLDDVLNPAWFAALRSKNVTEVSETVRQFELAYAEETKEHDYSGPFHNAPGTSQVYWFAGFGNPQTADPAKAQELAYWLPRRLPARIHWGTTSADPAVRTAAEQLREVYNLPKDHVAHEVVIPGRTPAEYGQPVAAERVLFYRRVLAAWQFLLTVDDQPALARLRELTELERMPLPAGRDNSTVG